MTDASLNKRPHLKITGPISVTPVVAGIDRLPYGSPIIILGPTGSGKSTFIEALSPEGSLQISSNQLEGFTQSIGTYKLVNVQQVWPDENRVSIYLVDVPGFIDTKISETSIVSMLREWMKISPSQHLGQILYLTPIQGARLPGSHRQVLRTVQAMTGSKTAGNITIVTTMWDRLWSDTAKMRAESNFNELRDVIWKEFMDEGGQILKFYNNQDSAVSILNNVLPAFVAEPFSLEVMGDTQLKHTIFGNNLRENLLSRIQNLDIEKTNLQDDLNTASKQSNETLKSTLATQLEDVQRLLTKFTKELHDNFGPDDDDVGSASSQVNSGHLEPSPESELVPPHQDLMLSTSSSPEIAAEAVSESDLQKTPPEIAQVSPHNPTPSDGMVIRVIRALKCWGEDARRRYDD